MSTQAQARLVILLMGMDRALDVNALRDMIFQQSLLGIQLEAPEGNQEVISGLLKAYNGLRMEDEEIEEIDFLDSETAEKVYREFYEAEWKRYGVGELHPEEGFMPFEELPTSGWDRDMLRQVAELDAAWSLKMKRIMQKEAIRIEAEIKENVAKGMSRDDAAHKAIYKR